MIPLFFGETAAPLYGVYHPALGQPQQRGVVLCYPFGQEYMRCHRAFRQMALALSKRGMHVLRFDYYGTGDSAGDATEARTSRWVADTVAAIEELKDTADIERVVLVGLRLGGALATLAASQSLDSVESIVLWDPVIRGTAYLREMLDKTRHLSTDDGKPIGSNDAQTYGINGFPLTPDLRRDLKRIDLSQSSLPNVPHWMIVSHEREEFTEFNKPVGRTRRFEYKLVPSHGDWNFVDEFGGALVASQIVREITDSIA